MKLIWIAPLVLVLACDKDAPDPVPPEIAAEPEPEPQPEPEPEPEPVVADEPEDVTDEEMDAAMADKAAPEAPEAATDPAAGPSDPSAVTLVDVPSANVTVQSAESNGLRVMGLACSTKGGALLGSFALIGSLGKQKKGFDKCANKGAAAVVHWDFGKSKATNIKVTGAGKAAGCVKNVMKKVRAPFAASCGAVILMGNKGGADKALQALLKG